jgi:hypothetical protein
MDRSSSVSWHAAAATGGGLLMVVAGRLPLPSGPRSTIGPAVDLRGPWGPIDVDNPRSAVVVGVLVLLAAGASWLLREGRLAAVPLAVAAAGSLWVLYVVWLSPGDRLFRGDLPLGYQLALVGGIGSLAASVGGIASAVGTSRPRFTNGPATVFLIVSAIGLFIRFGATEAIEERDVSPHFLLLVAETAGAIAVGLWAKQTWAWFLALPVAAVGVVNGALLVILGGGAGRSSGFFVAYLYGRTALWLWADRPESWTDRSSPELVAAPAGAWSPAQPPPESPAPQPLGPWPLVAPPAPATAGPAAPEAVSPWSTPASPWSAPPPGQPPSSRRNPGLVGLIVLALLALGLGAFVVLGGDDEDDDGRERAGSPLAPIPATEDTLPPLAPPIDTTFEEPPRSVGSAIDTSIGPLRIARVRIVDRIPEGCAPPDCSVVDPAPTIVLLDIVSIFGTELPTGLSDAFSEEFFRSSMTDDAGTQLFATSISTTSNTFVYEIAYSSLAGVGARPDLLVWDGVAFEVE